jgi:hypothetical protein
MAEIRNCMLEISGIDVDESGGFISGKIGWIFKGKPLKVRLSGFYLSRIVSRKRRRECFGVGWSYCLMILCPAPESSERAQEGDDSARQES